MYTKKIIPAYEQRGKRQRLTGFIGELYDGETMIHAQEYSTNAQAEQALDALAFELLRGAPQAEAEPASTCCFCSKPHAAQACPEMRAMLFAENATCEACGDATDSSGICPACREWGTQLVTPDVDFAPFGPEVA